MPFSGLGKILLESILLLKSISVKILPYAVPVGREIWGKDTFDVSFHQPWFSLKLLPEFTPRLGWIAAVVLPTIQKELAWKLSPDWYIELSPSFSIVKYHHKSNLWSVLKSILVKILPYAVPVVREIWGKDTFDVSFHQPWFFRKDSPQTDMNEWS